MVPYPMRRTWYCGLIRYTIVCCTGCTGGVLRWEDSEVNDVLSLKGRHSVGGAPAKNAERREFRRGRDGQVESSGHEEADDIFESEFTMLKDLWKFDSVPFPVTKQVRMHHSCLSNWPVYIGSASS